MFGNKSNPNHSFKKKANKKLHGLHSLHGLYSTFYHDCNKFCNHSYDSRPNWTPLGPISITYRGRENEENFLKVAAIKKWWINVAFSLIGQKIVFLLFD